MWERMITFFSKKDGKAWWVSKISVPLHSQNGNDYAERGLKGSSGRARAFSSAGSEHLPYKQRVGGSNPSTPTNRKWLLSSTE